MVHMIVEEFIDEGRALSECPADDVEVSEISKEGDPAAALY